MHKNTNARLKKLEKEMLLHAIVPDETLVAYWRGTKQATTKKDKEEYHKLQVEWKQVFSKIIRRKDISPLEYFPLIRLLKSAVAKSKILWLIFWRLGRPKQLN